MNKDEVLRWLVLLAFIVFVAMGFIFVKYYKDLEKFEYYTFDNIRGTSTKCLVNNDTLECKIKGKMVEVKQFSILEKGNK